MAWHPLGFVPVAFSEIEAFPSAVLAHHYPSVPNWGDMTKFKDWPDAAIDVLVGGTPCQSFSVAGLRAGLADPRGNLALTYLAVLDRYRPSWCCWENVPGVLSADGGRALGAFLGGLGQLGYGFAYRVLDAQYFGLAQRRQRVFVVGHLGDWRRAAAVLFERASLSGHPAPRRETWEGITNSLMERPDRGGGNSEGQRLIPERERALTSSSQRYDYETETLIAPTLAPCLTQNYGKQPDNSDTNAGPLLVAFAQNQRDEVRVVGLAGALASEPGMKQQTYVSFRVNDYGGDASANVAPTLRKQGVQGVQGVRRLTPRECEKLQGFPSDYTLIPYRGKPAVDGPRYKALGNSMAVPVMAWIGQRIMSVVDAEILSSESGKAHASA